MENIIDSIKLYIYEKTSNPLITSFCISWSIWNYKFFIIFFSGESISSKLFELEEMYTIQTSLSFGLGLPLATTIFYIFVFPFISMPIINFHYRKSKDLKNAKLMAEGEVLLSKEKANKLLVQINKIEDENEKIRTEAREQIKAFQFQEAQLEKDFETKSSALTNQIIQKDEKIEKLEKEIEKLLLSLNQKANSSKSTNNDEDEIKAKLLLTISARGALPERDLAATTGVHKLKAEKLAQELESEKLLYKNPSTGGRYDITSKGKDYIISENLYDKY